MKPLAVDLCCGLGGWTEGLLAEGWDVVGFDNEHHMYGEHRYPAQLVLQDILTIDGRQFREKVSLIVASPPCQEFSYMSMPWTRGKQIARALRGEDEFPHGYRGSRTTADLTALFDACFRIAREADCPIVVENVKGAQPWVGRARWLYGSFALWGDVPALMPIVKRVAKSPGQDWNRYAKTGEVSPHWNVSGRKNTGGSWFRVAHNTTSGKGQNPDGRNDPRDTPPHTPHMTNPAEHGTKQGGDWFATPGSISRTTSSKSPKRKAASALIAKIPFELSRYIARTYLPERAG